MNIFISLYEVMMNAFSVNVFESTATKGKL